LIKLKILQLFPEINDLKKTPDENGDKLIEAVTDLHY
jgi:hypothetical protein